MRKDFDTKRGRHSTSASPSSDFDHPSSSHHVNVQDDENDEAAEIVTTSNELDLLFSLMFDELLNGTTPVVSKSFVVITTDVPNQRQQHTTPSTSITIAVDTPPFNIQTTPKTTSQALTQATTVTVNKNIIQAETNKEYAQVDEDEFINVFSTPVQKREDTSSRYVDSSNMYTFYQRYPSEHRWTNTGFELTAFSDSDQMACLDSCKSTYGGIQFLRGDKLVSWSSKKQDCTLISSAEAKYVSLSACCTQVL
ncbi:hypothetical protein Tco_1555775 [Tanacetum coccineum]